MFLVLFSTASKVTRLPFSLVCLRNMTFVLVVKVISFRVVFSFYLFYLFYLLNTAHVRQGNEKGISNTILAAPQHQETNRSTANKLRIFVLMFITASNTHLLKFLSVRNSHLFPSIKVLISFR